MTVRLTKRRISGFMAKVLDPLPDAELADPELAKLEKRARRRRWEAGMHGVTAASAHRDWLLSQRAFTRDYVGQPMMGEAEHDRLWRAAQRELETQVDRQLMLGAPDERALKWKQAHLRVGLRHSQHAPYEVCDARHAGRLASIAADAAWLRADPPRT